MHDSFCCCGSWWDLFNSILVMGKEKKAFKDTVFGKILGRAGGLIPDVAGIILKATVGGNPMGAVQDAMSALSGKSVTLGVADASDLTITTVSGDQFDYIVLFKDTGDSTTSPLIICIDSAVGLPFTPEGGSVKLKWSDLASKIFKL